MSRKPSRKTKISAKCRPNEIRMGWQSLPNTNGILDGMVWQSLPNKNGILSWKRTNKCSRKVSRKKSFKKPTKKFLKQSNDQDFWDAIKLLNWQDADIKRIQKQISKFRPNFRKNLKNFVQVKTNKLIDKYISEESLNIGDSSLFSLCAEVVSRGKDFYENINLKKLQKMIAKNDFYESFLYCFE